MRERKKRKRDECSFKANLWIKIDVAPNMSCWCHGSSIFFGFSTLKFTLFFSFLFFFFLVTKEKVNFEGGWLLSPTHLGIFIDAIVIGREQCIIYLDQICTFSRDNKKENALMGRLLCSTSSIFTFQIIYQIELNILIFLAVFFSFFFVRVGVAGELVL